MTHRGMLPKRKTPVKGVRLVRERGFKPLTTRTQIAYAINCATPGCGAEGRNRTDKGLFTRQTDHPIGHSGWWTGRDSNPHKTLSKRAALPLCYPSMVALPGFKPRAWRIRIAYVVNYTTGHRGASLIGEEDLALYWHRIEESNSCRAGLEAAVLPLN